MRVLFILLKLSYLVLPPFVIGYFAMKWDKPMILLGILFCYVGGLSKTYDYKGVPIFYVMMWVYFTYLGFNLLSTHTFFGICLFWGYLFAGWAGKCSQLIKNEQHHDDYQLT